MATEAPVVRRAMIAYRNRGALAEKIHGGAYQRAGMSDIIGCYNGWFIGAEGKVKGKKPTELQIKFGQDVIAAGGIWLVFYTVEEALRPLDLIDAGEVDNVRISDICARQHAS